MRARTPRSATFDVHGVVTALTGAMGALAPDVERCLLDLFAMHCYPSLAGMTQTFPTCHGWIA